MGRECETEQRHPFNLHSALPQDLSFFKNDDNKTDLNKLIADYCLQPHLSDSNLEIVVTYHHKLKSKSDGIKEVFEWIVDTHEEADNRMLIHIQDLLLNSITNVTVRSADTDVLVILIAFMPTLTRINQNVELWLDFGTGKNRKLISINACYEKLGENTSLGLLFFHAFTGCDSTASFYEKTKVQFFNSWFEHSSMLNDVFKKLSWSPSRKCVEESLAVLEEFVTKLYSKSPASRSVDEARFNLFANSVNDNFRKIPPTQDALLNHTLKCIPGRMGMGKYLETSASAFENKLGMGNAS